jgi:uncharacterized protein (DUF1919 family)
MSLNDITHETRRLIRKMKLKNSDFTIVSSNCVGGTIYKDLGLVYKSPFVGLFITPIHFVHLCENFEHFMKLELEEVVDSRLNYPLGRIDSVVIHFMHYETFQQAQNSWRSRRDRINYENLYFVLVERDGCSIEDLTKFDSLGVSHKISLTKEPYKGLRHSFHIKNFEDKDELGNLLDFENRFSGKRLMYAFNFIKWLNDT